jgi:hypothetical protein
MCFLEDWRFLGMSKNAMYSTDDGSSVVLTSHTISSLFTLILSSHLYYFGVAKGLLPSDVVTNELFIQ